MTERADLYLGWFMSIPDEPDCLIAYAQLNGVPFVVIVHLECGAVGITSIDEENEENFEEKVVPWLDYITDMVHCKLLLDMKLN